jgi:hypothetical protein
VKTTTRFFWPAYRAALAAGCLLALAGCRGEHSPGEANDHDGDHVGHVIPAHKPKTFPEAVRRLRELNDQIVRNVVAGQPVSLPDEKTLHMALDIANWLPEIAADSDMPETPWNEAKARSTALVADYQAILSGAVAGDARRRGDDAGEAISGLESLRAASDPRWFGGTGTGGAAP